MLSTNLLPPQYKKELKLEEARRIVKFLALGFTAALALGTFFLIPSFLPLYFEKAELSRALELEREASRHIGLDATLAEIRNLSGRLDSLKNILRPPKASENLETIIQQAGREIQIIGLDLKKEGELSISGAAPTRRALLNFEKRLRDSGRFQEISVPLPSIIRETNINFIMQGKLKPLFRL